MNRTQKVFLGVVGGIFALTAISSAASEDTTVAPKPQTETASTPAPEATTPAPSPTAEPTKSAEKPTETPGQENAREAANDYLDYAAFSKKGLIGQLKFEGYAAKDASYAANSVNVDWNEQAVKSAKDYLDYSAFSKSALIEQLEFEGYTPAQAAYGANQAY